MCEQTSNFNSNITNNLLTQAQEAASAVSSTLRIFDETESENLTQLYTTLSTNIDNEYQGVCNFTTLQSQSINVLNSYDASINVSDVTFQEDLSVMNNCILSQSSVTQTMQQIEQEISQKAASKSRGIVAIVALVIIIGILVIGAIIILLIPGAFSIFALFSSNKKAEIEATPQAAVASALKAEAAK